MFKDHIGATMRLSLFTSLMSTGVTSAAASRLFLGVVCVSALIQLCVPARVPDVTGPGQPGDSAPGEPGVTAPGEAEIQRDESANAPPSSTVLANPFGSREEDRKLLQSFIQANLKDTAGGPDISTWEQEVFFLFGLYDFDRSGHMDGLEMMQLLSDFNSRHAPGARANDPVVSMVDFFLQTQDLNQDGLLAPSELLSAPLPLTQESSDVNPPQQEQDTTAQDKTGEKELKGEEETKAEGKELLQQEEETPAQQEVHIQEPEQNGLQDPEAPVVEQRHDVPVHQEA